MSVTRRLARSKGVLIMGRADLLAFGAGLPDEEVRYLHAVVSRALEREIPPSTRS
jgi:hypothetical protein